LDWVSILGGAIAALMAALPIVAKYIRKLARIIRSIAAIFGRFIILETTQEQFLHLVADVLEKPETLSEHRETMRTLIRTKKEELAAFKESVEELLRELGLGA